MEKYKVLTPFFKISNQKNYNVGDNIELDEKTAETLMKEGRISPITKSRPIEEIDAEIKKANKKRK